MIRQEIQKLFIYLIFAAILIIPMLGFRSPTFEARRAFITFGVCVAILILNLVVKLIRSKQPPRDPHRVGPMARLARALDRAPRILTLGSLLILLIIFPQFANNYMIDVGITCLIYVALGLGLNIVVGLCGLLDLGYIAFYAVGAYTYSLLNLTFGISFWLALPVGVLLGMTCGCIIGYPTLKMRGDYLAIVTLGFGEIIRLVLNNWDSLTAGPNGLFGMKKPALYYPAMDDGGWTLAAYYLTSLPAMYYCILFIAILFIIVVNRLDQSRIGRAWIAIREDEFMESCIARCIVLRGGVGSIPGIVIAAILLIAVPEIFRDLQNYRMLAFGAIMAVMMIIRPEGLIPASRRKRELHEHDA